MNENGKGPYLSSAFPFAEREKMHQRAGFHVAAQEYSRKVVGKRKNKDCTESNNT
jgi:hypothetical protein